jgi:poly-gamma-glutamate capsule biosynthesis protein CapA/YwtB (metallophosphatase superfamily)
MKCIQNNVNHPLKKMETSKTNNDLLSWAGRIFKIFVGEIPAGEVYPAWPTFTYGQIHRAMGKSTN